jgi:hypothetical protein
MDKIIKIHNTQTGEIIERDINAQELEVKKVIKIEGDAIQAAQAKTEAAKAAAQAKLAALGLTTDDLKALGLGNN